MNRALAAGLAFLAGCSSAPQPKKAEAPKPVEPGPPAVLQFYASPNVIAPGSDTLLCYGTQDAVAIRIVPGVEAVNPSLARCIEVSPARTTTYTLVAANAKGARASAVTTIRVDPREAPPPPLIEFVSVSATTVKRGEAVQVCYGLKGARKAVLKPFGTSLPLSNRACASQVMPRSAVLELEATGATGIDRERIAITVVE
jgi:hypothetical protein